MTFFQSQRVLMLILLLALTLRLIAAFQQDVESVFRAGGGGDALWYLNNGWGLVSGQARGVIRGEAFEIEALPSPPVYLLMVGIPQFFLSEYDAARLILVLQALMGTGICFFAYGIARRIAQSEPAGFAAAAVLAVSPALIITGTYFLTETTAIFFLSAGLWAYTEWTYRTYSLLSPQPLAIPLSMQRGSASFSAIREREQVFLLIIASLFLGIATLTRAAYVLFPALLIFHIFGLYRRRWWWGITLAVLFLLVYGAVISTWTAYHLVRFNRLIVVSNQFMPAVWRGAVADETSTPEEMDALLLPDCTEDCTKPLSQDVYGEQVATTIAADLPGYIQRRVSEMLNASLIPYGTQELPGESLRDLLRRWLTEDFSLGGFLRLVNGDNFWLKLAMYAFQYAGIVFGIIGLWVNRRHPALWFIPVSLILYTHGIHLVLLALPRYLFATQVCWWILAAGGIKQLIFCGNQQN